MKNELFPNMTPPVPLRGAWMLPPLELLNSPKDDNSCDNDGTSVSLFSLMRDKAWTQIREVMPSLMSGNYLPLLLGREANGDANVLPLGRMAHLLMGGMTGSGKSACLHQMILSMLYCYTPDDLRLILVDTKGCEFQQYNGLPHLAMPVITDIRQAATVLEWATMESWKRSCGMREGDL